VEQEGLLFLLCPSMHEYSSTCSHQNFSATNKGKNKVIFVFPLKVAKQLLGISFLISKGKIVLLF